MCCAVLSRSLSRSLSLALSHAHVVPPAPLFALFFSFAFFFRLVFYLSCLLDITELLADCRISSSTSNSPRTHSPPPTPHSTPIHRHFLPRHAHTHLALSPVHAQKCGTVTSWKRVEDVETKKPKGFGFCEYDKAEHVRRALRLLNSYKLGPSELLLKVAST